MFFLVFFCIIYCSINNRSPESLEELAHSIGWKRFIVGIAFWADTMIPCLFSWLVILMAWVVEWAIIHHHHHHHHHTSSILRSETSPSRNYKTWKPVPGRFRSPMFGWISLGPVEKNAPPRYPTSTQLDGGFKYFLFSSLLVEDFILTNIFRTGWNHQQYPTLVSFRTEWFIFFGKSVRCSWLSCGKHVELHNYKHMICRFAGVAQLHHFVVQIQSNVTTQWDEFALWMTWIAYKSHRIRGL